MEGSLFKQVNLPIPLHVVSKTPGRVRLRISYEHRRTGVMAEIKELLQTFLAGVERVRTNTGTGSIVIDFTPRDKSDLEAVFATLSQAGMVINDLPTEKSTAASSLTAAISNFNQRLNLATEGTMDLRFLFPLLLALLALRQFFSNAPRLNTAPWYILAWYAFDSFLKFHPSQEP